MITISVYIKQTFSFGDKNINNETICLCTVIAFITVAVARTIGQFVNYLIKMVRLNHETCTRVTCNTSIVHSRKMQEIIEFVTLLNSRETKETNIKYKKYFDTYS